MIKDMDKMMKFFSLRLQGKTFLDISKELEISLSTVNRWNKFFKADIINAKNEEIEILRRKIAGKYEKYFNFLDESFDKIRQEILMHQEFDMTYERLIKNMTRIIDSIHKMDVFRKFGDKSERGSAPDNIFPENDKSQSYVPKDFLEALKKC